MSKAVRVPLLAGSVLLLAAAGVLRTSRLDSQPPQQSDNPARQKIEYRPGGFFPEGFPLHGQIRLLTPPVVEMGQRTRIRVEYTVGDMPIHTGMSIEVWKHFTSDVEEFQVSSPDAPAWFGVEFTAPGVKGKTRAYTNWTQRNTVSVFPYRKCAAVALEAGALKQGDKVLFDLGGPRGVRMQHYEENLFNFRFVLTRDEHVLGYAGDAALKVTGGALRKLRVQAPSIVKLGEAFPVEVLPQDEWTSRAKDSSHLSFRIYSGEVDGGSFRYEQDLLHYVARDVKARREGILRIGVQTSDGQFRALSNPIRVERNPVRRVYYGELHQHTYLHDGRGVFDELYLYGRQVGLLDFAAVTPHHMPMSVTGPSLYIPGKRFPSENWPALTASTRRMNGWEGLVTILGYEYSVGTSAGGHHNIFYNADQAPSTMQLDPDDPMAPVGKMLKTLQLARVPTLVIPHIGGGPPDWSHPPDPRIERLFEIASVHGIFEESWQAHLKAGLRQAASAAGDTHTTSMGCAYPGLIYVHSNALTGVYATGRSRQEIWDAMYDKRTFATTNNQRILLDFAVDDEPMGGEVHSSQLSQPRMHARISGTAPLLHVELLKNSQVIYSLSPSRSRGSLLRLVWGDNIYQRRAAVGLRKGELRPEGGRLRLRRPIHLDQAFEEVRQQGDGVVWMTAAVSNDRDGMLVDLSEVSGQNLLFRYDDADTLGVFELRIPLADLQRDGAWRIAARPKNPLNHPYMKKMGVDPAFFVEADLVSLDGPMDVDLSYQDRESIKPGDYYYVRVEQLDTNKAWSSPVWVN